METGSVENSQLLALNKNQPLEGPVRQVYRSAAIFFFFLFFGKRNVALFCKINLQRDRGHVPSDLSPPSRAWRTIYGMKSSVV